MQRFVILSQPRTGSTLLASYIDSHPGTRCLVEPINPYGHNYPMQPRPEDRTILPDRLVQWSIASALDLLYLPAPPSRWINTDKHATVAAGFKIMVHQIRALRNEPGFWRYLVKHEIPVILCFRRNILMQHISNLITVVTRQSDCWDGKVRTARVHVNTHKLESALDQIIEEKTYLVEMVGKMGLASEVIEYEAFRYDREPVRQIIRKLTGDDMEPTTLLSKQNPDGLADRITNLDEVAAELDRLGFQFLLRD